MNRAHWQIAVVLVACSTLAAREAQAGVKGNRYQGSVTVNGGTDVVGQTMDFRTNGQYVLQENQQTGTFTFNGTYQETDLGFISFWNAVVVDGSPDRQGKLNGISFLSFVTTVTSINEDVGSGVVAKGFSFRVGSAQRSAEQSGASDGIVGGSAE